MKAIVAGAGIGGLTAALRLHEIGVEVALAEAVRELKPLGVGINLLPHAVRELRRLGLIERLAELGIKTRRLRYFTPNGVEVLSEPRGTYAGAPDPQFSIHRGALQMLIHDAVRDRLGASAVETGWSLARYRDEGDAVVAVVHDADGREREERADLLVGADGINSRVRALLHPREGPVKWSGMMMWRGTSEYQPFLDGQTMVIAGHFDKKLVIYPISERLRRQGRSLINWVVELRQPAANGTPMAGDWNRPGRHRDFADEIADWHLPFLDVHALFRDNHGILVYPMIDRDPLPFWSRGRVTLLGDAAHPMYPVGSNGASQAILDAGALADSLRKQPDDVPAALTAYQAARLGQTAEIVLSNRKLGPEFVIEMVHQACDADSEGAPCACSRVGGRAICVPAEELRLVSESYKLTAGFDPAQLRRQDQSAA